MKKVILLLTFLSITAWMHAGFVEGTVNVAINLENAPQPIDVPGFSKKVVYNADGTVSLDINENFLQHFPGELILTGETDEDPIMHITKTVENSSSVAWTSYQISVSGEGVSMGETGVSDLFGDVQLIDPMTLLFSAPDAVLPGQSVTFDFDVVVETTGLFNFCVCQTPIPEPATLALLGLGGLLLRRRKIGR